MYIFIVNPIAGSRKAKKILHSLSETTVYQKMAQKVYMTTGSGHAKSLVNTHITMNEHHAVEGVVVIGGDGTLHEVINGLGSNRIPIAYIPTGSGNDFKRGAQITLSPEETLENLYTRNNPLFYWIGTYLDEKKETYYFMNCVGMGFDAKVAECVNKSFIKSLLHRIGLGKILYITALLREISFFKPFSVRIQVDAQTYEYSNCLFAVVNQHPYFGGGMKINPTAINNREKVSLLVVDSIPRWKVFALFLTVFFGAHLHLKEVNVCKGGQISIQTAEPVLTQSDGETNTKQYVTIKIANEPVEIYGARGTD
ncbi:MAG TPA: YegS/Rv2252/BmrU family lipid kinase [Pseudogracilibacillus sp.]|nr:YegS/Rv2252/BmrU family lipid kinase [Pseudogracilibacillus sp.]